MVPWNQAYFRILESADFRLQFGRMFKMDEFRYYAYAMKFENVPPALVSDGTAINTRSYATTRTNGSGQTTNVVPGPPVTLNLSFPAGAVLLGYSGAMSVPQAVYKSSAGATLSFPGPPWSRNAGKRSDFIVSIERGDSEPIMNGNPIDEASFSGNSATLFRSIPFGLAEAALGSGADSDEPADALFISPNGSLAVTVQSMLLPFDLTTAGLTNPTPVCSIHLVFHCMVPGTVTKKAA